MSWYWEYLQREDFLEHGTMVESNTEDDACPICLNVPETITCLKICNHKFCAACIEEWAYSGELQCCPLCRTQLWMLWDLIPVPPEAPNRLTARQRSDELADWVTDQFAIAHVRMKFEEARPGVSLSELQIQTALHVAATALNEVVPVRAGPSGFTHPDDAILAIETVQFLLQQIYYEERGCRLTEQQRQEWSALMAMLCEIVNAAARALASISVSVRSVQQFLNRQDMPAWLEGMLLTGARGIADHTLFRTNLGDTDWFIRPEDYDEVDETDRPDNEQQMRRWMLEETLRHIARVGQ